jgi:hypothetical protein
MLYYRLRILCFLGLGPIATALAFYFLSFEPAFTLFNHLYGSLQDRGFPDGPELVLTSGIYGYILPIIAAIEYSTVARDFYSAYRNWYWSNQ